MLILTCEICGGFIDAVRIPSLEWSFLQAVRHEEICPCCAEVKECKNQIAINAFIVKTLPEMPIAVVFILIRDWLNLKFPEFEGLTAILGIGKSSSAIYIMEIKGNSHGIRSGWFMWPGNFDPVWLENCNGFKSKAEVENG